VDLQKLLVLSCLLEAQCDVAGKQVLKRRSFGFWNTPFEKKPMKRLIEALHCRQRSAVTPSGVFKQA
jgi:hypothetical protein